MTIDPAAIELVTHADFELFVEYLNDHLADNGVDDTYFQPLQGGTPRLSEERVSAFRNGLDLAIGTAGWRRLWVMRSAGGQIVGHIDLRSHPERFTEHRCLLGMGVHRQYRRQRIGVALLSFAETWAIEKAGLEWIDLQVLAENRGAIELYCRMGFGKTGEIPEMFKIDGRSFSYVFMAKSLVVREPGSGGAPAPNNSSKPTPLRGAA